MKKSLIITSASLLAVLLVGAAIAGSVGGRKFVKLGVATGAGTLAVDEAYQAIKLTRISVENSINTSNVVTCTRIIEDADGVAYTQTVGAVTCSSGAGTQATLAHTYLGYGDTLSFSSLVATGSTVIVEYEVQQH